MWRKVLSRLADRSGAMRLAPREQASSAIPSPEKLFPYVVPVEYLHSIAHRDAMLVFPKADESYRKAMIEMIRAQESGGPKPLTFSLFELTEEGIKEL